MQLRPILLSTTMLTGIVAAGSLPATVGHAADLSVYTKAPPLPAQTTAVDGLNGKVDGFGGTIGNQAVWGSTGSLSIPLGGAYGAQLDGLAANYDDSFAGGVGGHLFWRNPSVGLLGVYASYTHWDQFGGVATGHVGAEGEYYFGSFSFRALAGVEWGNSQSVSVTQPDTSTLTQGFDIGTRFFDKIDLSYYLQDNLKLTIGHRYLGGQNMLALGGEYGFGLGSGVMGALFAEGRVGENDSHGVWGGVRIYFGQHDKPLVARHRQDDPANGLLDDLFTINNSFGKSVTPVACPPPKTMLDGVCINPPV